jgi:hypothetical protein
VRLTSAIALGVFLGGCVIDDGASGRYRGYGSGDYYGQQGYPGPGYQSYYGPSFFRGYRSEYGRPKKFEPEKHVKCNRAKQICYEEEGNTYRPSVRETRQYFGKDAAKDLKRQLDRQ